MTIHALAGNPGSPEGGTEAGKPHEGDPHAGHDIANLTSERHEGGPVGRRVCVDCDVVLEALALCGRATKRGRPCRVPVRTDLGHTSCRAHGDGRGRGRGGTPRRRAAS
jgi:hypothetical protein